MVGRWDRFDSGNEPFLTQWKKLGRTLLDDELPGGSGGALIPAAPYYTQ